VPSAVATEVRFLAWRNPPNVLSLASLVVVILAFSVMSLSDKKYNMSSSSVGRRPTRGTSAWRSSGFVSLLLVAVVVLMVSKP